MYHLDGQQLFLDFHQPPRVRRLLDISGELIVDVVCCINMDTGTPDDNIFAIFEIVQRYRCYGA